MTAPLQVSGWRTPWIMWWAKSSAAVSPTWSSPATAGAVTRQAINATPDASVPVDLDVVKGVLMPGDPAPLQELVSRLLVSQPGGYVTGSLDLPPVTEIGLDAAYVLCADDIALARPGAQFAARLGTNPLVIPGNHMTMLTQPATVADALLSVL